LTGGFWIWIRRSRWTRPGGCASSRARRASPWCASRCGGDANHRRRVRRRPLHRGSARAQCARAGGGAVLLRHARRGRAHPQGCGSVLEIVRACDRRHRRAAGRLEPARAIEHLHQALGARAALFAASARARHEPAVPKTIELARRARLAASSSRSMRRRRPAGPVARCDRGARARFAYPRLAGSRPRGAGVLQARRGRDRLGGRYRALDRTAHDRAPGQRAYWDSEIKRSQERGLSGYPVYTRKVTTDVSYLACAGQLFKHLDVIYPQFATHNAHSIAAVLELAPRGATYEFQRLHGMGRLLYAEAAAGTGVSSGARVCAGRRAQGPVGLSGAPFAGKRRQYLVREPLHGRGGARGRYRAGSDHRARALETYAHPRLPNPVALYTDRRNSLGVDLGDPRTLDTLRAGVAGRRSADQTAAPARSDTGDASAHGQRMRSPTRRTVAKPWASPATPRPRR